MHTIYTEPHTMVFVEPRVLHRGELLDEIKSDVVQMLEDLDVASNHARLVIAKKKRFTQTITLMYLNIIV